MYNQMRWSGWVVVLAALLAAGGRAGAVEVTEDRSDEITLPSAGEEFYVAAGGNYTFSGTINGNGALIKTGPGELYLSPSSINSYTGGTVVLGGTLRIADPLSISPNSMIIVRGGGSAGSAVIRSDDFVMVGDSGSGTLDISDGGAVDSTNFVVGNGLGSRGVARVAGDGSALTASDYLSVGSDGTGYLSVVQGGLVQAGTDIDIGHTSGSRGAVRIDGDGSKLEAGASLRVGHGGNGRLELYDNAAASAVGDIDIGRGPSGGTVVVGATASLSGANVYVGGWSGGATGRGLLAGTGTVKVGNGSGTVTVYGGDPATGQVGTLSAGDVAGEIGTLTIDGNVDFRDGSVVRVDIGKDELNNSIADTFKFPWHISSSTLTIDLTSVHSLGVYAIFENTLSINTLYTLNGESISINNGRFAGLNALTFDNHSITLDGAAPTNFTSTWNNAIGNGLWNLTDVNWNNTASSGSNQFLDGDAVAFIGPVGNTVDIKVSSGAPLGRKTVAQMLVDGAGDWTFNGDILADGSKTTLPGQTGKLTLRTTGSTTLTGDNQFHGGVEMTDGTLILGSDRAIGTYATNTTTPANSRGQLTAKSGATATVKITDDRVVSNRFVVEDGGRLDFDLGGNTLTIEGVKNTSLNDDWSVGGALQVMDDDASALTFVDGDHLVITDGSAGTGGGIGIGSYNNSIARDVSLDLSSLGSLTIKDTHAAGNGGGIAGISQLIYTASITLGDNLVFTGNSAAGYGGAVHAQGDITLGTGALFRGNTAGSGSALYGRNITVSGHSFFVDNSAGSGGTVEAAASGSATLNADTGPIAFSGNTNSAGANAIMLGNDSHLSLDGPYNIYLDDPVGISGSGDGSLTKNGTGMVQFVGLSWIGITDQQNGEVSINDGIVRLAEGARLQAGGNDGKQFTVESAATLAGNGSFATNNGFVVKGALSPDSDRFEIPTFNETTLRFLDGRTDVADDKRIGTLNFDGDLHLDGATLKIDLDPLAAQKNDVVEVRESGRLTFGSDASAVDVDRWAEGRFEFLKTAGGITGDNIAVGTVNGMSIGDRQTARLEVTANSIYLVNATDGNLDLVWTGTTDNQWDTTTAGNWRVDTLGGSAKFNPDDYVIFDTTSATRDVVIPDGATAQVAGMRVDGDYSFSGGGIISPSGTADHGQTITNALAINSGTATFANNVNFANGMTVAAGAAAVLTDSGSWNAMNIANSGTLVFDRSAGHDYTHAGALSGTGGLTKKGAGVLDLSADSSAFTGLASIEGGILRLSGTLGGGVDVESGATLAGWGEAKGATHIKAGGTLNPWNMSDDDSGSAGGILRLGSLTMDAGSTFAVSALDGLVRVDGVAAIDPGIAFRFDSSFATNQTKTILNAGTLDWPVNGVSGRTAFLEYVATRAATSDSRWELNLDLKILRTLADAAQSRNQRAVAGALGDWSDYYWSLMSSASDEEARYGLDMASGEAHADLATRLVSYSRDFWKFRRGGVRQARAVVASSDTANASLIHPGVDLGSRPLLWFEGGHYYSRSTSDSETARATLSGPSFAVGGETPVGASWLAGLAFRYGDHDFKVDSRNSKSDTDNYELGLYASRSLGCGPVLPRLTVGARGGYHSIDSRRIVPGFGLGDQRLTADYHAWSFSGYAELAAEYAVSESLVLEPYLNLDWTSVWNNGFSERGGDLALRVGSGHQGNVSSLMGVRLRARVKERLGFDADLGWRHTYGPVRPEASMLFVASPTRDSFTVIGSKLARDEAVVAIGMTFDITDRVGVRLGYDGTFGRKSLSHAVTATVGVGF